MTIAERFHAILAAVQGKLDDSAKAVTTAQAAQKSAEDERDAAIAKYNALAALVGDTAQIATDLPALEQLAGIQTPA